MEKKIHKEIMHFHYMTSIAMSYKSYNFKPQTCPPLGGGGGVMKFTFFCVHLLQIGLVVLEKKILMDDAHCKTIDANTENTVRLPE